MCLICEGLLYDEHRRAEAGPFDPCPTCRKFESNDGGPCYHCFSVGETIDDCPKCAGRAWSDGMLNFFAEMADQEDAAASVN